MQVGDGYFRMKDEEPGYDRPFAEADRLYRRESAAGRRQVPIESRFATDAYRMILYRVGRREGASAARLLDRISDRDARLFAQIELAAALAQLPEVGGICFG